VSAFVFSRSYECDLGAHVFPVVKYPRTKELLEASGRIRPEAFIEPRPYERAVLELVHRRDYLDDLFALRPTPEIQSSELPISREIVTWFETAVHGSLTATVEAMTHGAAFHIGGGFHHAYPGHAEGFCYLNDVAVAARYALEAGWAERVSVVDLDVHQGNGTARIFRDEPRVFTLSMHQENNYPPIKERSDLDIGLEDGTGDRAYLELLEGALETAITEPRPNLVFYLAGADPYREDLLGGLDLTLEGLVERDRRVFAACRAAGAVCVVVLAGGYAARTEDTAAIHAACGLALLDAWPGLSPLP
jgi:acetoin utilization deacetylase AcuC-like enzyme